MIKKSIYFIVCIVAFLEIAIFFLPKKQLWLYTQDILSKKYYISLNSKEIIDKSFNLIMYKNTLEYDKIKIAQSYKIKTFSSAIFEKIDIKDIYFDDIFTTVLPKHLDDITIQWTLFMGYKIKISAMGDIGILNGYIDILHKKIILHLKPSNIANKRYKKILHYMKKEAKGYRYVQSF